jgi:hypothetical protein
VFFIIHKKHPYYNTIKHEDNWHLFFYENTLLKLLLPFLVLHRLPLSKFYGLKMQLARAIMLSPNSFPRFCVGFGVVRVEKLGYLIK